MLMFTCLLIVVSVETVSSFPIERRRQTSSLFNPGVMLAGVGMQAASLGVPGGTGNPAGTPVIGSNPSQPLQTDYTGGGFQSAGVLSVGSVGVIQSGVIQSGNPGGSPHMTDGNLGYSQSGNPGGRPGVVVSASGAQYNYLGAEGSRQDYTGANFDPNSHNYRGTYSPTIGKRSLGKRFNPDVTNSELISNPNPVNVGLAFNAGSLMFMPGSASGSVSQTGVAAAHSIASSSAAAFNPNTLSTNLDPAGTFNPANPRTAGTFNPNAGQSFIPSDSQSAGSVQSAGNFNPNSFTAGTFDPNAIPPAHQYDVGSVRQGNANFDPSIIGLSLFPPNAQSNK